MKFLVDAQLPRRIARKMQALGIDAIHTLDLPDANRTADATIAQLADAEPRVVVTKDADFLLSFKLTRRPRKLLLVNTGNISNDALEALLFPNLPTIIAEFETADLIELNRTALSVHDDP
jgi:predicted nuclease of predicted toxin-antitoxin system